MLLYRFKQIGLWPLRAPFQIAVDRGLVGSALRPPESILTAALKLQPFCNASAVDGVILANRHDLPALNLCRQHALHGRGDVGEHPQHGALNGGVG
jgi:hypothetical protein